MRYPNGWDPPTCPTCEQTGWRHARGCNYPQFPGQSPARPPECNLCGKRQWGHTPDDCTFPLGDL